MMANISFHSNSPVVATGGGTKLLSNHHFVHHLFESSNSSSPSSAQQQQQPSTTLTSSSSSSPSSNISLNSTNSNTTSNGSLPSSSSSTATVTAASIVTSTTTGKIITTIPGTGGGMQQFRTINLNDTRFGKLLGNVNVKRINGQTATLTPISLTNGGVLNHHNSMNGSGGGVITLSHIKAATAAAAAANSKTTSSTTSGSTPTNTTSSGTTSNNVLIYNIKADSSDPNSKPSTVLLATNDTTLLTNSILNSAGSLKFFTTTSSATSGSGGTGGGDDASKPIIIYPKLTGTSTVPVSTIISAASMNSAHVLKSTSGTANGGSIKKIKLEFPSTTIVKEEVLAQTTPLLSSVNNSMNNSNTNNNANKVVKLKGVSEVVTKVVNGPLDCNPKAINQVQPKIVEVAMPKVLQVCPKSNIENCLPNTNNSSVTTPPLSQTNHGVTQRLSLNSISASSLLTSTSRHNKYYSLSNISPYLPDEIFDTDEEEEEEEEEELMEEVDFYDNTTKDLLLSSSNIATIPALNTTLSSTLSSTLVQCSTNGSNNQDHSSYAKMTSEGMMTVLKEEAVDDVVEMELDPRLMMDTFDDHEHEMQCNVATPILLQSLVAPLPEVVVQQSKVQLKPTITTSSTTPTSTLRVNGSSGIKKAKVISSALSNQKPKVTNFTTVVTPKASGGAKFTVLKTSTSSIGGTAAPKLIAPPSSKVSTIVPTVVTLLDSSKELSIQARREQVWAELLKELMPRKERMSAMRKDAMDKRKYLATNCEISVLSKSIERGEFVMPTPAPTTTTTTSATHTPKVVMIKKRPASATNKRGTKAQKMNASATPSGSSISSTPTTSNNTVSVTSTSVTVPSSSSALTPTSGTAAPRTITLHLTADQLSNLSSTFLLSTTSGGIQSSTPPSQTTPTTLKLNTSATSSNKTITISSSSSSASLSPAILTKANGNGNSNRIRNSSTSSSTPRRSTTTPTSTTNASATRQLAQQVVL